MPVGAKKFAAPADLRWAGPAGEVKVSYDPKAFTWYGAELARKNPEYGSWLYIGRAGTLRLSVGASARFGRDTAGLAVGLAPKALAIRRDDEKGLKVSVEEWKRGTGYSLRVACLPLAKILAAKGWPVGVRLPLVWDEESQMLVADKPAGPEAEAGKEEGKGGGRRARDDRA